MRAAEAAKNTASLIENTVANVNDGADLTSRTNEAFSAVSEKVDKVAELVTHISAASREQAEGIGQINTGVAQIDSMTQRNAANAEELSSASEELSARAYHMRNHIKDLKNLIDIAGSRRSGNGGSHGSPALQRPGLSRGPARRSLTNNDEHV
jgi:methyl-accepting chemotaxis protein